MCDPITLAVIVSTAATAGSGYMQYQGAKSQAAFTSYQNEIMNQQLRQEARNTEIQQIGEENRRLADARSLAASNRAQLAAYGVDENISFLGGLTPADTRSLRTSIQDIRLSGATSQSRIADQIAVNRASSANASAGVRQQMWSSIGSTIAGAANAYSYYNAYRTPSSGATYAPGNTSGGLFGSPRFGVGGGGGSNLNY
jgi:hypothetical protein